jgi:hypothetical protein
MNVPVHDVTEFTMADMATCGSALRRLGESAGSMEEVAQRVVQYLYCRLSTGAAQERPFALVRLFKTHPYGMLPGDLQAFARRLVVGEPEASTKCLTLLATEGARPQWRSRKLSAGHQAIPLVSEEGVTRIPVIANLVSQFGLKASQVLNPDPGLLADLTETTFNVFHVPEALGSRYVPAQKEFVIPEGVESCLGFGGMLPCGDLFAVIMFARVPICSNMASMFKSLSLSVKTALLPFSAKVFA